VTFLSGVPDAFAMLHQMLLMLDRKFQGCTSEPGTGMFDSKSVEAPKANQCGFGGIAPALSQYQEDLRRWRLRPPAAHGSSRGTEFNIKLLGRRKVQVGVEVLRRRPRSAPPMSQPPCPICACAGFLT
jgi:hypothetical protein